MMQKLLKNISVQAAVCLTAAVSLSGCVVSDDPAVNTLATTAAVGTAAGLLYYSLSDGYYYDGRYNRMPRGFRPDGRARIYRVDSMDGFRRPSAPPVADGGPRGGMRPMPPQAREYPNMRSSTPAFPSEGRPQPPQRGWGY